MRLTQILYILVSQKLERNGLRLGAWLEASSIGLVDNDAVGSDSRDECQSVAELCPFGIVVEGNVGQSVASYREEEGSMANEPALRYGQSGALSIRYRRYSQTVGWSQDAAAAQ